MISESWQTPSIDVHDATGEEAGALCDIFNACGHISSLDPTFVPTTHENIGELIARSRAAREGNGGAFTMQSIRLRGSGELVGYYHMHYGLPRQEILWLSIMVIHPGHQKHGIGREIIDEVARQGAALRYQAIWLKVYLKNWPALRHWFKAGFSKIVEWRDEIGHQDEPVMAVILERNLAGEASVSGVASSETGMPDTGTPDEADAMHLTYTELKGDDAGALADFLLGSSWPFHGGATPSRETILKRAGDGEYWNDSQRTFWIADETGEKVGLIQLKELGDPTPLFDLRVAAAHRGRGIGTDALRWLTRYLFETIPTVRRIEGYTRIDNTGMRKAFRRAGYIKEAHHRRSWRSPEGIWYDAIGYCMLREDWRSGEITPFNRDDEKDLYMAPPIQLVTKPG